MDNMTIKQIQFSNNSIDIYLIQKIVSLKRFYILKIGSSKIFRLYPIIYFYLLYTKSQVA